MAQPPGIEFGYRTTDNENTFVGPECGPEEARSLLDRRGVPQPAWPTLSLQQAATILPVERAEPRRAEDKKDTNPKDLAGMAKPPMSTVPKLVLAELGVAMFEGTAKYGRHNYRGTKVLASVYLDATNRHLTAWEEGQDIDPGSGLNHITKAIASLVVLRDAAIVGQLVDDRPPSMTPPGFWEGLENKVKDIITKYGHIKPKHYTEKNRHEN